MNFVTFFSLKVSYSRWEKTVSQWSTIKYVII